MGDWQYIRTEVADRIALLTIEHPPVNSFSSQVLVELDEAVDQLLANDAVKAIIITGGGTNVFVAGADIPELKTLLDKPENGYAAVGEFTERAQALFLKLGEAPKPIIAALSTDTAWAAGWNWQWPATCGFARIALNSASRRSTLVPSPAGAGHSDWLA